MYVKTSRTTSELYVDGLVDEPIEFDEDGIARVPAEVGDELVERFEAISVEEDEREGEESDDRDPESGSDDVSLSEDESGATVEEFEQAMRDVEAVTDPESADDGSNEPDRVEESESETAAEPDE